MNKHRRQSDTIIVWSDLLLLAFLLAGCGGTSRVATSPSGPSSPGGNKDETPPALTVPFVAAEQAVAFYAFGVTLPSGVQNPTIEIETLDQTPVVVASSAGKVVNITVSSNGIDRAITIVPSDASVWSVIYDHVTNPRVTVGQSVAAGTALGTVGILNNGRGRTEIQINRFDPSPTMSYCPQTYGTAAFNDPLAAAAQRLNGTATLCTAATVRP